MEVGVLRTGHSSYVTCHTKSYESNILSEMVNLKTTQEGNN